MSLNGVTFGHVNSVARDWRRLSRFYQTVFGCEPVPPRRTLSGPWLEAGGRALGTVSTARIPGRGSLTFVYARDTEDHILELHAWSSTDASS